MARAEQEEAPEMDGQEGMPVTQEEPGALANAPWWLISAGIHIVLLLGATLVVVDRMIQIEDGETVVSVAPKTSTIINEVERPRDVFERKGIPKDDNSQPTEEPAIFFPEAKESDH